MSSAGFDPADKVLLDFGCGSGLITAGLACFLKPRKVIGVDISMYVNHEENQMIAELCGFQYEAAKEIMEFKTRSPADDLGFQQFDCIFSWSVIEHVDRRQFDTEVRTLCHSLKRGGLMILQSAPLYFSPYGSHVYSLPAWSHLTMSDDEFRLAVESENTAQRAKDLISCKETLNKLTIPQFTSVFEKKQPHTARPLHNQYRTYTST